MPDRRSCIGAHFNPYPWNNQGQRDYIVKVKDWPGAIGAMNFDADGNVKLGVVYYEFVNGKPVFSNP